MYSFSILLLGILPTAVLFALAHIEKRGNRHSHPGASPLKVMAWTWLIGYTLKSLYLSYAVVHNLPFRPDWIAFHIVDTGQLAIVIGTFSMIAGYIAATIYLAPYRNVTRLPRAPLFDPRIVYYPFFAFSFALLAVYFQKMGFIDQIRNLRFVASKFFVDESGQKSALGFLSIGGDFLLVTFIYYVAMARKITWVNAYTLSIFFLALSLFLGSRRNGVLVIIILVLIVVAVRQVNRNALKRLSRYGLIVLTLMLLSFASQIRNGSREGQTLEQLDIRASIEASAIHAFEGAYFMDPAKTAAIVDQLNDPSDFFVGASFLGFIIAPIPRVLWPEKPSVRVAPYVAQELFGFDNYAGVPPGAVGEFYMNFGWVGIVMGMATLGAFLAFVWWRHQRAADPRFTIVRYAFVMIAVIYFLTVEFSAAIVIYLKYFIAILIAEQYWRYRLAREGRLSRNGEAAAAAGPARNPPPAIGQSVASE